MPKSTSFRSSVPLTQSYVSGAGLLQRFISMRYLRCVAAPYRAERSARMACFANEEIGNELAVNGIYERLHIDALLSIIGRLSLDMSSLAFCDVGANIGNHSMVLAPFFKKTYAFEPNPDAYYLLTYNMSSLDKVESFHVGLGDTAGMIDLYQNEGNIGASTMMHASTDGAVSKVRVERLDDICPSDIPIGVMKIDVEGMEYQVLNGATETINNHRPVIAFEQHESDMVSDGPSVISWLQERDYSVCWLDLSSAQECGTVVRVFQRVWELLCGRTTRIRLVVEGDIPKRSHTMLIAIPAERMAAL
ncbi:FkbM family methyltransferase [Vibrio sp. S4M6]|uniref:FkbM family methyltransferase n=1 Tax=Vibrio sinus TaxID=2946865 RepID=UPI002029E5EE|nr:FkbM family methyltransferase [Vibrio sinus]MCL9782974.1 FkbM family methyltransferase [Vibrio sinus]